MEQEHEQSPIHREPTACSEPPVVHGREDAFKNLLLHISQQMGHENTTALAFTASCTTPAGGNPSALDVLQTLVRQGDFSARSCIKLDKHLRRISRCDLADLVRDYMEEYPELRHTENGLHSYQNHHQHPLSTVVLGPPTASGHQEEFEDRVCSELHIGSRGPVHSTPRRHKDTSPELSHELLDVLAINHSQNTSAPHSSDPLSEEISPHPVIASSYEQLTPALTSEYHSSFDSSNLQWSQEAYSHPSQSANISRDSSDYSLSSSVSQLSKASVHKASQMLYRALDIVANCSQDQLWYRSTSSASIRHPHSDTSSIHSEFGTGRENPWAKKQSHSYHGRHSTNPHRVTMRRVPSAPARNRDHIHTTLASSAPHTTAVEFVDTPFGGRGDAEGTFPVHTPNEEYVKMKPSRECRVQENSDRHSRFDDTPRQSVAVDSRRQSTISDATIKRNPVTSEATSETTVTSPRTSVYGKEAVQPELAEEVSGKGDLLKPMSPPPASKEKPHLRRKLSFLRSKSRTSSSPSFTWKVLRKDLIKPIWEHQDQITITRPSKLELDTKHGKHNPKLTFQLYPYGLHQETGKAVTMAVRIATPDKCPPLPLSSEITVRLVVWDGEGKEVKRVQSATEKLSKTSIFYVYSVTTHSQLKESRSKYFHLEVDVTCCGLESSS